MADVFTLTPSEEEEMLVEVADREIDLLKEALKTVHDDGFLLFGPSKPAQQLSGFMTETHPNELLMLLDENYVANMDAGVYPPPTAEGWYLMGPDGKKVLRPHQVPGFQCAIFLSQEEAVQWGTLIGMITPEMMQPQIDPMTMQPIPPQLPVQQMPSYWGLLMQLPRFDNGKTGPLVWELNDLRRLWAQYGRKLEESAL